MQKLFLFLMLLLLAGIIYARRDVWYPKLEGIGTRYQTIRQNDGTLAEGNFPLTVSGGIDYETANMNGSLVILSDANFYIYGLDGNLRESRQHAYANAMMEVAGKKALIYESSGNQFRVESKSKTLYTKELDEQIVFARLSSNGNVAVVTTSQLCACTIRVYDENGQEIYSRDCVDRVSDLAFNPKGNGCSIVLLTVQDGQILSTVRSFLFDSKGEQWTSDPLNTFCISLSVTDSGVFLMGDTRCAFYDNAGQQTGMYAYTGTLVGGSSENGKAALLFENETKRRSSLVLLDSVGADPRQIDFDTVVKNVHVMDGNAYVLTKVGMETYSFDGTQKSSVEVSDSYDDFLRIDKYLFLFGYDKIDRMDFAN